MENLNCTNREGISTVKRCDLFNDVVALFQDDNALTCYPLRTSFVGECAIDCGGFVGTLYRDFGKLQINTILMGAHC